jgi:hypothetical protein
MDAHKRIVVLLCLSFWSGCTARAFGRREEQLSRANRSAANTTIAGWNRRVAFVGIPPTSTFRVPELLQQCNNSQQVRTIGGAAAASSPRAALLFLHIFKAAGSTTRNTLKAYARRCGLRYKTCGSKCSRTRGNYICLADGRVASKEARAGVRVADVVAGHLWFGMHRYTDMRKRPVYITCLRSPIATAISGHLYTKAHEVRGKSAHQAALKMRDWLRVDGVPANFLKRLTGHNPRSKDDLPRMALEAISNLRKYFAVVGVVELYATFVDLVARLVDPLGAIMTRAFWEREKTKRENSSVMSSSKVLAALKVTDRGFVDRFNASLQYDWNIYRVGYQLCLERAASEGLDVKHIRPRPKRRRRLASASSVANFTRAAGTRYEMAVLTTRQHGSL